MVKTLIHELGHHLDPELELAPRGEAETVAEATAFIIAAHQGIDTGGYTFPYIAAWAGTQDGPALLKEVMGRVQAIAHRLLETLKCDEDSAAGSSPPALSSSHSSASSSRWAIAWTRPITCLSKAGPSCVPAQVAIYGKL